MTQHPMHPIRARKGGLSQSITLSCTDPWGRTVAVPTTLGFRVDDPYAVALMFHSASADVEWVVARDLLLDGLGAPCGEGDVKAYPSIGDDAHAVTILDFCSPDGRLIAQADSMVLQRFLAGTFELVPAGSESSCLDIDGVIAALLGADRDQ
ncbi:hypothetical protein JCM18899A_13790 [Nocardioides sp. AN3]